MSNGPRFALVGLSHRTAPVEVRERVSVSPNKVGDALGELGRVPGIVGVSLLSTCNRTEIIAETQGESATRDLVATLARIDGIEVEFLENYLYVLEGEAAVRHLFKVASSLDSLVIGEPQIVGQVKDAYQAAGDSDTLSAGLHLLYQNALSASKKVRTDSGIGEAAVSVPFAAVELAKKIFDDFTKRQILIIGSGKMGELAAKHLQNLGIQRIFCANRTLERAAALAERMGGAAIRLEDVGHHLAETDIVISSTGSTEIVLSREEVEHSMKGRRSRPMFLIDIAVPRDIDPTTSEVPNVYLYNIDDLQEVVDQNRRTREGKLERAENLLEKELRRFLDRLRTQAVVPTIQSLRQTMEELRLNELDKARKKLGPLTPEQDAALEALTASIVNKILHYPISHLRNADDDAGGDTIRKIFGLKQ